MKKIILLLCLVPTLVSAQTVVVRIIANDGTLQTTNTVNLPAVQVQGLLSQWGEVNQARTNAGQSVMTFSVFVAQEINDKGEEWRMKGGMSAITAFFLANGGEHLIREVPPKLALVWQNLTLQQRTNAMQFLQQTQ